MTDSIRFPSSLPKSAVNQGRWPLYLFIGLLANATIWGAALFYLQTKKPTYTSTWAINIPGIGSNASVSVPGIGQASYENSSPYGIGTVEPRQNYKFLVQSGPVLKAAAAQLNMPLEEFGAPRIKLLDSTTIMEFEFKGASPEEAQKKSLALYKALQSRINELRVQEATKRDVGFESALSSAKEKLNGAQRKLSEYKARSGLSSSEQLNALSNNIEELRRERAEILAQQQEASAHLRQLSVNLDLSAQQASDAFVLQTDQIFQQNLKDYSAASANLVILESKFLPNHPTVVAERAKQNAARLAFINRSQSLLGRSVSQENLQQFSLGSSNTSSSGAREQLFQELVTIQAKQRGFQAQAQEINKQIIQLEGRLKLLAQQEATLQALMREAQVAEAVFSSTVVRLDIGRSNAFGSYPLIQMVAEPSLSAIPTSPKKNFILLGAGLGSFFVSMGLVTLWLHQRKNGITEQDRKKAQRT